MLKRILAVLAFVLAAAEVRAQSYDTEGRLLVNGKPWVLGQSTMANSARVVIASDQSAIPVSQSGTWNIGTVTTLTTLTGITNPVAVTGTFWQATQPVSGTISISGAVDTELPAAAALADATANPTAPAVGAFGLVWNGATWDRLPGTVASGSFVQGPKADGTTVGGNPVLMGGRDSGGNVRRLAVSTSGVLAVGSGVDSIGITTSILDAVSSAENSLITHAKMAVFNGTTWDRLRGNTVAQFVQGPTADGVAVTGSPVRIGGKDGGGLTQDIATDASGELQVDVLTSALPTGASTLAEQQTQTTSLAKIDNVAHAGADVALVEHVPLSAQFDDAATTTVTENQIAPLRITSGRALHVATQGTTTVSGTVTANAGTGTFTVSDGAGAMNVIVDSSALPTGASTLAEQQTQTTALQIIDNLPLAQGSATAGQTGPLIQGAVTTSAPTYTTGNTNPISLDTAGNVRVNVMAGGAGDGAIQDGVTASIEATVFDFVNSNPLGVVLRDTNGDYVSVGGGTQYAEDTVAAAAEIVTMAGVVRDGTPASLVDADGDRTELQVDDTGRLWVNNSGVTQLSKVIDGTGTDQTDVEAAALASATLEGLVVRPYPPGDGTLTSTIRDTGTSDSLNVAIVDASGNHVTSFGGGTQYAEDTALAAGEQVTMAGVIRDATPGSLVDLDGDRTELQVDGTGYLWVNGSGVTQPVSGTVTAAQATASSLNAEVQGDAASGAAKSGNPVQVGHVFNTTQPTVTTGQVVEAQATARGALIVATGVDGALLVGDGAGSLNTIVDSGTLTTVSTVTAVTDITNPVNVVTTSADQITPLGTAADGAAVSGNPIRIAGKDGGGLTQDIITDTAGELQVDVLTMPSVTIGTFPDNEPINVAQLNGVAVTMGNGISGTGVQRVTIASDSTGTLAGVTTVTNLTNLPNEGQQTAANSISVTPDTDNDSIGATAAAPPGEATYIAGLTSGATAGFLAGITVCNTTTNIDIVTATTTLAITGVSGRHVYICALSLVTALANNVSIISGTTTTTPCDTSAVGIAGGVTAAEGYNFAANGGMTQGSGLGVIISTNGPSGAATGDNVCIVTSAATQLSGSISYAIY
jgi:hypothetical protein